MEGNKRVNVRGEGYADVTQVAGMTTEARGLLQGGPARHGESFGSAIRLEQGELEMPGELRHRRMEQSIKNSLRVFYGENNELVVDERIDVLFDCVDDWLLAEDFERTDEIFRVLNESTMDTAIEQLEITLALLTVTHGAQSQLPARARFVKELRDHLKDEMSPADVEAHLHGLD